MSLAPHQTPKPTPRTSIITVCAGHSASDPGNTANLRREAVLMTDLRDNVARKLMDAGYPVRTDGARKQNKTLSDAMRLIKGSAIAVELHTNAANNSRAAGVEVIASAANAKRAQLLAYAIADVLDIPLRRIEGWLPVEQVKIDRGFTPGFVREGGLIIEVFFQSNTQELRKYEERHWLVASAIARTLAFLTDGGSL